MIFLVNTMFTAADRSDVTEAFTIASVQLLHQWLALRSLLKIVSRRWANISRGQRPLSGNNYQ